MESGTVCNDFSNSCKRYTVCFMKEIPALGFFISCLALFEFLNVVIQIVFIPS